MGLSDQYTDAEAGLIYLRDRYYDPATAQYLSVDPAVGITQSPYGYVNDNPLNGVDPLGLWGWNPLKDVGQAWHDTLGQHWRGTVQVIGVVAGVAAAATGVGALVEGTVGLGVMSAGLGVVSGLADLRGCISGSGTDQALNCAGVAAGGLSGILGGFGAGVTALTKAEIIGEDSILALSGGAAGAFGGFGGGGGALFWDLGRGLNDLLSQPCPAQ